MVNVVRDLGIYLDNKLTMKQHISRVVSSCFFSVEATRQIRRFACEEVTKRLVTALVLSRLNYCNAVLTGLPGSTIRPLQHVQNAAARLITGTKPREHITPVLMCLHWLPIKSRIYQLCFRCTSHTSTSDLHTWLRRLNSLQHLHHGLASGLPVTSCNRSQH